MAENKLYYCECCHKAMDGAQFYTSNNLEKYPNEGKMPKCKKCLTLMVDNWNPDTYLWILEEVDVPYVPEEWNKLLLKYGKDNTKLTGTSIIGRYLSKMKLKQFKDYRWSDSEFIQEVQNQRMEQVMKAQGYSAQEIARAKEEAAQNFVAPPPPPAASEMDAEDYFDQQNDISVPDETLDLTDEDKLYLRMKWGKAYKPEEWVRLEQLYEEMMNSYDIQGAGHKDTLKLICKTSLKANQLIDIGDVEGFQKMSKVYDSLMKSGKFTAAQNKADSNDFVDSIGELIEMCEREGYIERYYNEQPNDRVDLTIKDMQRYTRTLIEEETSLGAMVEKAIRENAKEDEANAQNTEDTIIDDAELSIEDLEKTIKDDDYLEFEDFKDGQADLDQQFLESFEK